MKQKIFKIILAFLTVASFAASAADSRDPDVNDKLIEAQQKNCCDSNMAGGNGGVDEAPQLVYRTANELTGTPKDPTGNSTKGNK